MSTLITSNNWNLHFLLGSLLLLICSNVYSFTVTNFDPPKGPVGTTVTFTGSGFKTDSVYKILFGGIEASQVSVSETELKFNVSAGSKSGLVEIIEDGAVTRLSFPFEVNRNITVSFSPPPGINPVGYFITTDGFSTTDIVTGNEQVNVAVPIDRPKIIWAMRENNDPVFFTVSIPDKNLLNINASSTATGLVYFSPLFQNFDTDRTKFIIETIDKSNQDLAEIISAISGDAQDYNGNPLYEEKMQALMTTVLKELETQPTVVTLAPSGGGVGDSSDSEAVTLNKELNPDYSQTLPATKQQLEVTVEDDPNSNTSLILTVDKVKVNGKEGLTPLDWRVELNLVAPSKFPNGFDSINAMQDDDVVDLLQELSVGFVAAKLDTDKLNYISTLYNEALNLLPDSLSLDSGLSGNQFIIPKNVPAIYMIEAYSGNLWYGAGLLPSSGPANFSKNQSALLAKLDQGEEKWAAALRINFIQTVIDLFGAGVDLTIFSDPTCLNDLVNLQIDNTGGALITQLSGSNANTNRVNFYELFKTFAGTAINVYGGKLLKGSAANIADRFARGLGKTLLGTLNITKKLSFIGNTIERFAGYALPSTLAVERFVVVVGNPFDPTIRSFHPKTGRDGDLITISGSNFPDSKDKLTVKFCRFDSTDGDSSAELSAEILTLDGNELVVKVPENWLSTFSNKLNAAICIFSEDGELSSSLALEEGCREFTYVRPPEINPADPDVIDPKVVAPGGVIRIKGKFFDGEARLRNIVLLDGVQELQIVNASDTFITVRLSGSLSEGQHTLSVKLGDIVTQTVNFTIVNPTSTNSGFSSFATTIRVNLLDMSNNAADGKISIFEAFAFARGDLGRGLEQHDPRESLPFDHPNKIPFTPRETDFVNGDDNAGFGGGPNVVDRISLDSSVATDPPPVVILSAPIPALSKGDEYDLRIVFDGAGLPADSNGLTFDGDEAITVKNFILRNFDGHGVLITNGTQNINLVDVGVENCGGNGFFLTGDVTNNILIDNKVTNAGENGILLSGAGVKYNIADQTAISTNDVLGKYEDCSGYGVLIEDGATFNQVSPGTCRRNTLGGVRVIGESTDFNVIGINSNVRPRFSDVYNNGGYGVYLGPGVNQTVVRWINPAGNQLDGILLEGPDCSFNQLDGIFTGMDYFTDPSTPTLLENNGSGIRLINGAHHNLLGSMTPGGSGERGSIIGNINSGILLDGADTAFNTITRMNIGDNETSFAFPVTYSPNGQAGIHIRNGSHNNILGNYHSFLDLHILGQVAGILIEGENTHSNTILGNQIGSFHGFITIPEEGKNTVGIHLKDKTYGNTIGLPGARFQFQIGSDFFIYQGHNIITNSTEAGILIENAGSNDTNILALQKQPNVIQNNRIGENQPGNDEPNKVGIKIIGNELSNIIGGSRKTLGNRIFFNDDAGIHFENVVGNSNNNLRIDLRNNLIENNGLNFATNPGDPFLAAPKGVGLLVSGTSENLLIGKSFFNVNEIKKNVVGVYFDAVKNNELRSMRISENIFSGVFLRDSENITVGGTGRLSRNLIYKNGSNSANQGGVVISKGKKNIIRSNSIGIEDRLVKTNGNLGDGVIIVDSSQNKIGDSSATTNNEIGDNKNGVVIKGSNSFANLVAGNYIGVDRFSLSHPNSQNGVLITDAAHNNLVGGQDDELLQGIVFTGASRNIIHHNTQYGVAVEGSAAANAILRNRIHQNTLGGIKHNSGGNNNQQPPIQGALDDGVIRGEVPDLASVPVGSIIEVFDNPLGPIIGAAPRRQGYRYLGRTLVDTGGIWRLDVAQPFSNRLTMTATNVNTGSTSEFGTDIDFDPILSVGRSDGMDPANGFVPSDVMNFSVLSITVEPTNGTAIVGFVKFKASGTLNELTDLTGASLVVDADRNGVIDDVDITIGSNATFDTDDGTVTFVTDSIELDEKTTQQWVLVYHLAHPVADGTTFSASLVDAANIPATFIQPFDLPAVHVGQFPIESDNLTIGSSEIDNWKSQRFSAAQLSDSNISGPFADPDKDGLSNLLEHALGTDPLLHGSGAAITFDTTKRFFQYKRLKSRSHLRYDIEVSDDLNTWLIGPGLVEEMSVTDNNDTQTVTLNLLNDMNLEKLKSFARLKVRLK